MNKSIILNYLIEHSTTSRAVIASQLKISPPTVSKIVDKFISEGLVTELGKDKSKGGKKATKICFNAKNGSVIGVDLAKDKIRIVRSDLSRQILEKHIGFEIYYRDENLLDKVIKEISYFIRNIEKKSEIKKIPLKGICLGLPADIDSENGIVKGAPLFPGWNNLNLGDILSKCFPTKIFIENSKNMAAIGEKYLGGGRNLKNFIILEIGEGIGAGIIINDQLYQGSSFSAGEVGFIVSNKDQLYAKYTIKGLMEKISSPSALRNEILNVIKSKQKTLVTEIVDNDLTRITPAVVCEAAMRGDNPSKKIIKNMVENLSIIMSNLVLILNPEIIVVGGDILELPEVEQLIIEPIRELIKNVVPFDLPIIKKAVLGVDAGVLGCSIFAINNILGSLYPYKI